jgi:hypothetical protein
MWSLDLFDVTLGAIALKLFHVSRADVTFTSVAALLWLTRVRIVASTLGLAKDFSGTITGWWTWTIDDLAMNGTNAVLLHAVKDGAIVLPWLTTWLIDVTKMFALAVTVLTLVGWATEAGLS